MMDYRDAVAMLEGEVNFYRQEKMKETFSDVLKAHTDLLKVLKSCRNELCERCGSYKNEYGEIWCDNCRWR